MMMISNTFYVILLFFISYSIILFFEQNHFIHSHYSFDYFWEISYLKPLILMIVVLFVQIIKFNINHYYNLCGIFGTSVVVHGGTPVVLLHH